MGFFLQLQLLLWKNFTLKRRKPVVLMLELVIPLVLFIILVGIRSKQPAQAFASQYFPVWPLPSAGLISVMQAFCDKGEIDQYGFFNNSNATVTDFLTQLNSVAENNNFFEPKFTLDELEQIPRIYRSIVEDPINIKRAFESEDFEMRPTRLFPDLEKVEDNFVNKLNFNRENVGYILRNVSVDKKKFYSLMFNYSYHTKPSKSSILTLPEVDIPEGEGSGLDTRYAIFEPMLTGLFSRFLQGNSPNKNAVLEALSERRISLEDSLNIMEKVLADVEISNAIWCDHDDGLLGFFLVKCDAVDAGKDELACQENLEDFRKHFCSLNDTQRDFALKFVFTEVNKGLTVQGVHEDWNYNSIYQKIQTLAKDLNTFITFKKTMRTMTKLTKSLPSGYCKQMKGPTKFDSMNDQVEDLSGADSIMQNLPDHEGTPEEGRAKATIKKPNLPYALLKIWKAMQKTVCGKVFDFVEEEVRSLKDMGLSKYQMEKLELLIHVLYNNPKVLYSPTGTQADLVIQKANQTFVLFDKVNRYAKKVLLVGAEIKEFLGTESTEQNLITLQEIQLDLVNSPLSAALFSSKPAVTEFLSDPDITSKENFLKEIDAIMLAACSWEELMKGLTFNVFKGFRTEDEMLTYYKTKAYFDNITVLAGVVFHMNNDGSLPNHMIYKIRQNASLTINTKRVRNRFWFPGPRVWGYNYYYFGFVWVQDILERAMVSLYAEKDVTSPGSYLQQFPYPCYIRDQFLFMIQHVMPLCLTISWVYSVAILVQHIVYEKEQRLKEVMKMMGLKNGVLWIAWFLTSFSQMTVTIAILTVVLKYGKVLTYSNPWIVFLTLECFSIAIIMFSFLVSAMYSKAKLAAACAGIIYFMSYVPYMYIAVKEESANEVVPVWLKAVASLLAPTAFGLGAKYFAFYEEIGVGVQWHNIGVSPAESDSYNLAAVLIMLSIDSVYYGIIFWYIENIHPGAFGLPRPWYFPLQKSYWLGYDLTEDPPSSPKNRSSQNGSRFLQYLKSAFSSKSTLNLAGIEQDQPSTENFRSSCNQLYEPEQEDLVLGVSVGGLSKRYKGSRKYALKDLTLNLFEGQITALLGHNGAGKTTTISILTGLLPPTSGYALIYGRNIRVHMDLIRRSLGMCPQHNVLFDDLTLEEHMWFYSRLKCDVTTDFDAETNKLITDLKIPNKRHHKVSTLSGGMKRKLSVAIAFVGGSKTVILDEPTAGVDPYARRAIWDLIIKYKKGRTILLSTHHMDEADILADKIAILESGRLKCFGSPLYLKNHLGEGYHLFIVKALTDEEASISSSCSESEVTAAIQKIVRTARLVNESKHELHYVLPLHELRRGNFVPLFQYLSQSKEKLFISSFGVKNTTLEEIFIKVIAERRNSDTSIDKVMHITSAAQSRAHSRQPSGTLASVHNRQLSRDMKHYRHSSSDIHVQKFKKMHSRNNSTDNPLGKLRQAHSRQASDVIDASVPLLFPHRRQHSHDIALEHRKQTTKGMSLNPDFERELMLRLKSVKLEQKLEENMDEKNANPEGGLNASAAEQKDLKKSGEDGVSKSDFHAVDITLNSPEPVSRQLQAGDSITRSKRGRPKETPTGGGTLQSEKGTAKGSAFVDMHDKHFITGKRKLMLQQFRALIWKRYLFTRKNIEGMFSQILLPAFFVSVAMSVALTSPAIEDLTEMILSPSQFYNMSKARGNFIAFANNKLDLMEKNTHGNADSSDMAATLLLPSGVGATCVLRDPYKIRQYNLTKSNPKGIRLLLNDFDSLCADVFLSKGQYDGFFVNTSFVNKSFPFVTPTSRERKYPICTCNDDDTGFVCPSYGFTDPETVDLFSGDTLIDISGQNESQYYLYTTDNFRLSRYGGLGFGLTNALVPPDFGKSSPMVFRKVAVRQATKIWFNNQGFHSIPIFVNTMNNAILRANIPPEKGSPSAYGITVINHPFPNSQTIFSQDEILQGNDVLIAIFIIVAMSFVPASFVLFLVYERSSKSKHLQIISGVHRIVYWVSNYIWDILNYTVPATFCILILLIFDVPAYTSKQNFPAVVSLFFMYGWSVTPVMYPASFVFKDPSSAYISLIVGNLFVGITCVVTSFLLEVFSYDEMLGEVHMVLKSIFLIFPNYCLGRGLMEVAFNDYYNQFLLNTGQYHKVKSPFAWDIISRNLVSMAVTGTTFFMITLLCEYNFFRKPRSYNKFILAHNHEDEDADVYNEKKRVARGSAEDVLTVRGLTKVYHSRKTGKHLVVDELSWGVPAGECFGLLGVNGAGKSSTFKMLTGDTRITKGDATISGFSVKTDLYSAYRFIGYCPQFDALYDELSAREHLTLYATLRGVDENYRTDLVEWALAKLDINQYADRPVGTYSGGNKRKVSTAIALIGGPSLIFLDEPTTGMDPYSKRFLWDLMLSLVKDGKSIVFTSHSMEECEVLCTRLAIMVNGRFKCLGSTQHLKNKFGDGYTIKIKCQELETEDVENYMKINFPCAVLEEKHYNCLHYELHSLYACLDDIFHKMETAMKELFIQDYSVSQNTLDNVFINFVKDQNEQYEVQLASLAEQELSSDNDDEAATPESRNGFGVKTVNCEKSYDG